VLSYRGGSKGVHLGYTYAPKSNSLYQQNIIERIKFCLLFSLNSESFPASRIFNPPLLSCRFCWGFLFVAMAFVASLDEVEQIQSLSRLADAHI